MSQYSIVNHRSVVRKLSSRDVRLLSDVLSVSTFKQTALEGDTLEMGNLSELQGEGEAHVV